MAGTTRGVMYRNYLIGQRNTLCVWISLIYAADENLVEQILEALGEKSDEELYKIAEAHAPGLKMSVKTVRAHLDKIIEGKAEDTVWPPERLGD